MGLFVDNVAEEGIFEFKGNSVETSKTEQKGEKED